MKAVKKRAFLVGALALAVALGLLLFGGLYIGKANDWALYPTNRHLYTNGLLTRAGRITDRRGTVLACTRNGVRYFHEKKSVREATLHAVGDLEGYIRTGIHTAFRAKLCAYSPINGTFDATEDGRDIALTLDTSLCIAAQKALGNHSGTVAVCNYRTGELLCMVSTPTYDVNSEKETEKAKEGSYTGVFLNRFLSSSYTPGSTFKIVTAAAALETYGEKAYDMTFTCRKGTSLSGEWLSCLGNHGTLSLEDAFSHSCNSYFAQMAVNLGSDTMQRYADHFGFNTTFSLSGIQAVSGRFRLEKDIRDIDLGWAGIGQYTDLMNPLQYLHLMNAIANKGDAVSPYLVDTVTGDLGINLAPPHTQTRRVMKADTAQKLTGLMRFAVANHYGDGRFDGLNICGKTGTAEVGDAEPHAEFVGFCQDRSLPLSFVVVVENAGSGNGAAVDVAAKVLKAARSSVS